MLPMHSLFLLILFKYVTCANILFVTPIPSPSHHIWSKTLALGLVEKSHNVTMLSVEGDESTVANFTIINIEGVYEELGRRFSSDNYVDHGIISPMQFFGNLQLTTASIAYQTEGYKQLLNYPKNKFDLIIFDSTLGRYMYHLIEVFENPPAIGLTPFLLPAYLASSFGAHPSPSYQPYFSTGFSTSMNFKERFLNFFYTYADIIHAKYIFYAKESALLKHYPQTKLSPEELERKLSLLLANVDCILDYPRLLPPNIIPVGGLHARPAKRLPKDLKTIMDSAEHGVILFSLGSNVRSDKLDSNIIKAFLEAFSKLPQTILWKFESDLADVPKNVIIRKWLPQNDLLGHENVKLLITHGGALSAQEALYHGVPVIGIPFYSDQLLNIGSMVQRQLAQELNIFNLTLEDIDLALGEVLNNNIYLENMKALSKRYRDQPQTALERAVFWVEYVLRHGSVEHLVISSRDMPLYHIANLDVLFAIFLILISFILSLVWLGRLCKLIFKSFKKSKLKKF